MVLLHYTIEALCDTLFRINRRFQGWIRSLSGVRFASVGVGRRDFYPTESVMAKNKDHGGFPTRSDRHLVA